MVAGLIAVCIYCRQCQEVLSSCSSIFNQSRTTWPFNYFTLYCGSLVFVYLSKYILLRVYALYWSSSVMKVFFWTLMAFIVLSSVALSEHVSVRICEISIVIMSSGWKIYMKCFNVVDNFFRSFMVMKCMYCVCSHT